MNKILLSILSIIITLVFVNNNSAQTKLAQTGLKFLSVGSDARASALGEANTSLEGSSSSMFYNPSAMARQTNFMDVTFGVTQWIADINYLHASLAVAPEEGLYGVFGLSIASVDYGLFKRTIRDSGDQGFLDLGNYSPSAMAIGLGYARALSDKFSVGGNVRYVYQDLGDGHVVGLTNTLGKYEEKGFDVNVLSFDFGILYRTGFKSLNFGMSLRNFSQEIEYVEESFQLPLTFKIGLSMNIFDIIDPESNIHSLVLSFDADHPRDYKEQLHIGGEYNLFGDPNESLTSFSVRAGYITPTDEQGINAGIGLKHKFNGFDLGLDYSYLAFGIFNNVHRFAISISY